jgi:outer membrane protein assembly factor BamB
MNHPVFQSAAAVLLAVFACSTALAENWPQWRGPAGNGVSSEEGLPIAWSEESGVAWKVAIPEWGTSTPAVWGDAIFLTTQQDDKLLVLRLNKRDGSVVWTRQVGTSDTVREAEKRSGQKFHQLHNNASPSPVTDGELVVVHFGDGELAAYDFRGERLWQHNLQADYGRYTVWWGHANSPILFGDLVISVCMQDSLIGLEAAKSQATSYLVAHHKRTGKEVWKTMRMTGAEAEQGDSYTTPILFRTPSRLEMLVMGANQLDAYDPSSGKQFWSLPGIVGGRTITGPTAAHGLVYATQGMRGNLLAVKVDDDGELDPKAVVWKHSENTSDTCCPVVWDGLLFTISDNGIVQALDAHSGKLYWKQRIAGNYKASPVAAEARIYFTNLKGTTTVISASTRFEKLAENQLEDEFTASPSISDGRMYLRGRKHLYCLEKK